MSITGWPSTRGVLGSTDDRAKAADQTAAMERSVRVPRWPRRPSWADDALLAAGLAAFGWVASYGAAENQPTSRPPDTIAWALLLLAAAV